MTVNPLEQTDDVTGGGALKTGDTERSANPGAVVLGRDASVS